MCLFLAGCIIYSLVQLIKAQTQQFFPSLQPLHIVEDESVTLFYFIAPFQACSKEVLYKFKDLSGRDGARRDSVILYVLNVTLLRRYLRMSKFT